MVLIGGKKRATHWMNLSQLRRAVWLRRLSDASQSRLVVTRDSEVVQMPFQHLFHPSTGFRDGVVCRASRTCA
jgi:hypothetical protein